MSESNSVPSDPDERIEWIIKRGQMLDSVRKTDWIADEIEKLWNNPDEYEQGNLYEVPEGVDGDDYALFKLGVAFGTDYEHFFPRDSDSERQ